MSHDTPAPCTRQALLDAATAELRACGHAGVSLRAVARRAGVSHAAPKNHFGDRAGLLTAVAARGFADLAAVMDAVSEPDPAERLAVLGVAYLDFGLADPARIDLMFRPVELHPADPALRQAQAASVGALRATVGELAGARSDAETTTLMAWSLVHGLVVLATTGALSTLDDDVATARERALRAARELGRLLSAR